MDQTGAPDLTSNGSISSSLLEGVRRLDSEAWRKLSRLFGPEVYRWARKAGLQPSDASDVMQEVFRAVAASVGNFRRDRPNDSFRGWLWTITQNKIRDHFRRKAVIDQAVGGTDAQLFMESIPETPPADDESSSTPQTKGRVSRRALDLIRREFEKQSWDAFWRTVVDGVPAVEVARELGMTAGAVRQAKYRILRRLRQETDGLLD